MPRRPEHSPLDHGSPVAGRRLRRALVVLGLLALPALALSGEASAATVVVSPLLVDASVQPKQRDAVHKLITSELDFQPGVEGVVDVKVTPPTLDQACLANPRCLYGLATANGGTALFSGRMAVSGQNFVLELVYVDGAQARKQQFQVPSDPTRLANAMTPIVQQMLTGGAPAPAPPGSFDADPEPSTADLIAAGAAPPPAGSFPPPGTPAPAPLPPPVPVAPAASDAELAGMISFNQSASDISAEEIDQMIRFGPPPGNAPPMVAAATPMSGASAPAMGASAPQPMPQTFGPPPQPAPARARDTSIAEEEAELESMEAERAALADLESAPAELPLKARLGHTVQFTARGGFSKYYAFNFVTGGAELGVAAVGGLHLVGGVEVYAVKRVLPPDVQLETGIYSQWNTIFPLNAGLLYKFPIGMAQPYVGADAIFVQYYQDDIGADWAGGGRFRTGVDLMFVDNFGLNVNVAAGAWFGQNWSLIQEDVGNAGFLPQVSAGTVVAF